MEPVTHVLTGTCLARTGLNRRAAYATAAMAISAELPDIDTLWGVRGSVASFQHHRGITHTFLGIPFEAGFVVLLFFAWHRLRGNRGRAKVAETRFPGAAANRKTELTPAPVRWGALYGFAVLALLSHILLDYTNNYGVRPFFPFNPHWYAASIVFIFDPLLFLLLVAGLLLPSLFGLVGREVGARRELYRGRGWARAALIGVVLLWSVRSFEHAHALALAGTQTLRAPGPAPGSGPDPDSGPGRDSIAPDRTASATEIGSPPAPPLPNRPLLGAQRSLASPDPLSIFRWYVVTDFGPALRLGLADTRQGTLLPGAILTKPDPSPILRTAEGSRLGRAYLDWSPMPFVTVSSSRQDSFEAVPGTSTKVQFADPRFMGDLPFLHRNDTAPLTGTVLLDAKGSVVAEGMEGRLEQP